MGLYFDNLIWLYIFVENICMKYWNWIYYIKKCRYKSTDTLKLMYHCCSIDISATIWINAKGGIYTCCFFSNKSISWKNILYRFSLYSHATQVKACVGCREISVNGKWPRPEEPQATDPPPPPLCTRTDVASFMLTSQVL